MTIKLMLFFLPTHQTGAFNFFEGDIVLKDDEEGSSIRNKAAKFSENTRKKSSSRPRRDIIRPVTKLWKYGKVPYVLDSSLSEFIN